LAVVAEAAHSLPKESDLARRRRLWPSRWTDAAQDPRRHIPPFSRIGDNRNRLLVVSSQHTGHWEPIVRLKLDPVTDTELEHLGVRMHLAQEAQALNYAVIQIGQLCFRQAVEIDSHS
jgi:hypothetical protein